MSTGFISHEALSSTPQGQASSPAPTSLEARVILLEAQIQDLIFQLNGFDEAKWRAEYKAVIRELVGGDRKPLDKFMKKYRRIPKEETE